MKINDYFITLKNRIDALDRFLSNPDNYKDLNNPFTSSQPKTYVWAEEPEKNSEVKKSPAQ